MDARTVTVGAARPADRIDGLQGLGWRGGCTVDGGRGCTRAFRLGAAAQLTRTIFQSPSSFSDHFGTGRPQLVPARREQLRVARARGSDAFVKQAVAGGGFENVDLRLDVPGPR